VLLGLRCKSPPEAAEARRKVEQLAPALRSEAQVQLRDPPEAQVEVDRAAPLRSMAAELA